MDYLEVLRPDGVRLVTLEGERLTVGKARSNDVSLEDKLVSKLHAVFERYKVGWVVRDVGSTNGTSVNGERIWTERPLRSGDEVIVGATRMVYRSMADDDEKTARAEPAPDLTRRERDVLLALCKPLLHGDVFTEPASIRGIATDLVVTEAAVKQHLTRLYEKFGVTGEAERRRVRLANEAIRRGVVTFGMLRTNEQ